MPSCVYVTLTFKIPALHTCFMPENTKTKGALEAVCTPTLKSILGLGNTKIISYVTVCVKRRK